MEVGSRRRVELVRDREISPERTKVWTEPRPRPADRKVPVVYYLSRNGHLEHPHFMEVSVPSGDGLYLRDVINRLDSLRGKGMASMYAWSSKRSYKNGFVWQDLSESDFIYPAHGNEYILKGSKLLLLDSDEPPQEAPRSVRTAWGSFDLNEYKVYKNNKLASDAWTQTEDMSQGRRPRAIKEEEEENTVAELSGDEISPPCSTSSSSETLEGLIKADGSVVPVGATGKKCENGGGPSRGRKMKTPAALMQLISCGSIPAKGRGFSLVSHFKGRMPRVVSGDGVKGSEGAKCGSSFSSVEMEDKEYFSGSLIEIKKKATDGAGEFSGLRRSSSYNADRGLKMELTERETEGVRARCIPRKPKAAAAKREENPTTVAGSGNEANSAGDQPLPN